MRPRTTPRGRWPRRYKARVALFRAKDVDPTFDAAAYRPGVEALDFRTLHEPGGAR